MKTLSEKRKSMQETTMYEPIVFGYEEEDVREAIKELKKILKARYELSDFMMKSIKEIFGEELTK